MDEYNFENLTLLNFIQNLKTHQQKFVLITKIRSHKLNLEFYFSSAN